MPPERKTVLLDTHAVHWLSAEPERISPDALEAIETAEELTVSAISWYELAWLARNDRIRIAVPVRAWLEHLAGHVRTVNVTAAIADTATALDAPFPGDPADRLIYASAIETGSLLISKDRALRDYRHPRSPVVW